jgi:methionine synthase II (cobalamin-independent)
LEETTLLVDQVDKLLKTLEQPIYLTTSCGLEYLPRASANAKHRLLAATVARFA